MFFGRKKLKSHTPAKFKKDDEFKTPLIEHSYDTSAEPEVNPLDQMLQRSGQGVDLGGAFDMSATPITPSRNIELTCKDFRERIAASKQKTEEYKKQQKPEMLKLVTTLEAQLKRVNSIEESGIFHHTVREFVEGINRMIDLWERNGKTATKENRLAPIVNDYYKDVFKSKGKAHSHIKLLHDLKDGARMLEIEFLRTNAKNLGQAKMQELVSDLVGQYREELARVTEHRDLLSHKIKTALHFQRHRLPDGEVNKRVEQLFKETPYGQALEKLAKDFRLSLQEAKEVESPKPTTPRG